MWQDLVPLLPLDTPEVQQALANLDDRGWLSIYYASAAYLALVQHDGTAAGHYTTLLHGLEESRSKALAIVMYNTLVDQYFDEHADGRRVRPGEDGTSERSPGVLNATSEVLDKCFDWAATILVLSWWCPLRKVSAYCARYLRTRFKPH